MQEQGQKRFYAAPHGPTQAQEAWRILNTPHVQKAPPRAKRFLVPTLLLGACAGLCAVAYFWMGWSLSSGGQIPMVAAPEGPYKVRPQGADETDAVQTNKTIYDQLTGQGGAPEEVRLREVPQDPVEAPPALPDDFVKALAQSPLTSKDLDGAKDVSSPFAEGEETGDPFVENDEAFFEEGRQEGPSFKTPAVQQAVTQGAPRPPVALKRAHYALMGVGVQAAQSKMLTLELASAPTQDQAKLKWQEILRDAGALLASYAPIYTRVDHGVGTGIQIHVRLQSMVPEKAQDLSRRLVKKGVHVLLLPY